MPGSGGELVVIDACYTINTKILRVQFRHDKRLNSYLFFMMFEGVNRIRSTAWFRPWSNVVAGLADMVNSSNQHFPWTDNIRIFLSFDQSLPTFPKHELFIRSCGAFVERFNSEQSNPYAADCEPVSGYISGEMWQKWTQRDTYRSFYDSSSLEDSIPPEWLQSVRSDVCHLLHLGLMISDAENIRINLPISYLSSECVK